VIARHLAAFLLLLVPFCFLLLIGPRVPNDQQALYCVVNEEIGGPFGISLNCDSQLWIHLARYPRALFDERCVRQDRPGLALLAAVLGRLLAPILPAPSSHRDDSAYLVGFLGGYFPYFVAFIVLNAFFLCTMFALYVDLVGPQLNLSVAALAVGSLLLFNDAPKAFFWSPHTPILNLLASMFCLWTARAAWTNDVGTRRRLLGAALVAGVAFTGYASYLLFPGPYLTESGGDARRQTEGPSAGRAHETLAGRRRRRRDSLRMLVRDDSGGEREGLRR
jgi:hypothetical protein